MSKFFNPKTALSLALMGVMAFSAASLDSVVDAKSAAKPAAPAAQKKPAAPAKPEESKPPAAQAEASAADFTAVDPMALMRDPAKYLNQKITFEGTFNRFSDIGLDYKRAFRDSRDYVSFLILRPDVTEHTIPMSELKLFFPRKKSDEVLELDTGDKISIRGTVFSTALNEPWVDVDQIKIVQKTADKSVRKEDKPEL